jgi:hypothetical protein
MSRTSKVLPLLLILNSPLLLSEDLEVRSKLELKQTSIAAPRVSIDQNGSIFRWKRSISPSSNLTIEGPADAVNIVNLVAAGIKETHLAFEEKLAYVPSLDITIKLVSMQEFHTEFDLPSWTNAIYFKGEIILPIASGDTRLDIPELTRSVRHEYVHALINRLGNGKVPGWLDEGLAQWTEGNVHSSLPKIFRTWLSQNSLLPFGSLSKGFTQLPPKVVPVAYAQSLYATRELIRCHGFNRLTQYLEKLRKGSTHGEAFETIFGESEEIFGKRAEATIRTSLRVTSTDN